MAKWTDNELVALDMVRQDSGMAAYHRFGGLTNYSKSYNAFEVKRRRVGAESPANRSALEYSPPPVTPDPIPFNDKTFIGLTMAYWDLETTFSTQPLVLYGAIANQFGDVYQFRKGPVITDDKQLVHDIASALSEFDIWVTWNGKLFDAPVLNGRLRYHGLQPLPLVKHIDAMYYATGGSMRIGRRSLQSVSEYFDVPNRKTPLSVRIWDRAMSGDEEAYALIVEHCDADVLVTRDVFNVLKTQVANIHR
jgi:uncharacterized protein YprB with RNaseH-like and TPR domain